MLCLCVLRLRVRLFVCVGWLLCARHCRVVLVCMLCVACACCVCAYRASVCVCCLCVVWWVLFGPLKRVCLRGPCVVVLRRCPTLPHPPRCSTIGAVGLSFRVRNGCRAFPPRLDRRKLVNRICFSTFPPGVGGCGLVVIRTVVDELCLFCVSPVIGVLLFSVGQLVPVGSRAPRGASTSGLSTR